MKKSNSGINKTVAGLIKSLSTRNRDIISRRFGLKNGRKETLESIGKEYGITRERVRQIEEATLNQLIKSAEGNSEIQKQISLAKDILNQNDGIMKEKDLFEAYSGSSAEDVANASLVFTLTLGKDLKRFSENDKSCAFWAVDKNKLESFQSASARLISLLNKNGRALSRDDFFNSAKKDEGFDGQFDEKQLNTVLAISKEMDQNIFNQVGLATWPEIKPKGVRDKAYLVLKKENSPKHFSEIAKLINSSGFDGKKANVQTVHNELIKDVRFVLVGRGMYALNEWGYKPGTVKDVLVDILKTSSKPLPKDAIIAKVMDVRMVKENTILLNLQDSKIFKKNEEDHYELKEV